MSGLTERLKVIREKVEELKVERREGALERREKVKARSGAELQVREMEESGSKSSLLSNLLKCEADSRVLGCLAEKGQDRLASLETELEKIETDITSTEASLMESTPAYEDTLSRQTSLTQSLETAQTTLNALFAKQGRSSQFSTQEERDEHLEGLIRRNEETLTLRRNREEGLRREGEEARKELEGVGERRRELRKEMERRKEGLGELREEMKGLEEEKNEKSEQRKELWRGETKLSVQAGHANDALKQAERTISSTMDRVSHTSSGPAISDNWLNALRGSHRIRRMD